MNEEISNIFIILQALFLLKDSKIMQNAHFNLINIEL
jgi:hypothetical protein